MQQSTIYAKPTVKEVIFQVRFPQLFYIEGKIGDFQLAIMEKFPKSELLIQQQVAIGFAPAQQFGSIDSNVSPSPLTSKSWSFESGNGLKVILSFNSLSITSNKHISFSSSPQADENFRNMIIFVIDAFFKSIGFLPIFTRIGLRYIDVCNNIPKTTEDFKSLFNSRLPIKYFRIEDSEDLFFSGVVNRKKAMLIYKEKITKKNNTIDFVFDFDAYKNNIKTSDYQKELDCLYEVIAEEYDSIITKKMKAKMIPIKSIKKP